jgi:tetratricopeptide (TPR) repeat protein
MRNVPFLLRLLLVSAACVFALSAQDAGKRIALIIGNDTYSISPLKNAVNDAHAMDKALKTSGFQTTLVENAKKADMDRVIGEFLDKIGPDDTVLFFYAGHGVQIENENFLVPVDFSPGATISAAKFACMSLAQVFDELKRKRARKNIVILDACRSNPVTSKYSLAGGLAKPQDAPRETFIAFSTSPGQTAADNPNGHNSWFTEALTEFVAQPALTIEINDLFTRVKKRVFDATENRQTPWTTSNMTSAFYFHAPSGDMSSDLSVLEKWLGDAHTREQNQQWTEARELVDRVLQRKPGGAMEAVAKKKLAYLTARRDAQAKFDAGDFAAAAALDQQALTIDPFATSAALQAVNALMLADRVPDALGMLKAMRARGTSEDVQTANKMLKELGAAFPDAQKEIEAEVPQPPPAEELFQDMRADKESAKKYLAGTSADLTRVTKDLKMESAAPVLLAAMTGVAPTLAAAVQDAGTPTPPVETSSPVTDPAAAALAAAMFHLEVVPTAETTRNLRMRKPDAEEYGFVEFNGPIKNTPVVFEGQQLMLPTKLKLAPGKYEIRAVEEGKVLTKSDVEVGPRETLMYQVKR